VNRKPLLKIASIYHICSVKKEKLKYLEIKLNNVISKQVCEFIYPTRQMIIGA